MMKIRLEMKKTAFYHSFWRPNTEGGARNLRLLIFSVIFMMSCQKKTREVSMAFYHWKTNFSIDSTSQAFLKETKTEKIYLKILDIDGEKMVTMQSADTFRQIVPTIFITNASFKISENPDFFAEKILQYIENQAVLKNIFSKSEELQIDCDWTESTREPFFLFLKKIKERSQKKICVTLRLHQIKFKEKTGVPPADRTMLMAYNMGDLNAPQELNASSKPNDLQAPNWNSILDIPTLKSYIEKLRNYPLPIDVALPIFSWGVVMRDGEAAKIINNLTAAECQNFISKNATKMVEKRPNIFSLTENIYFKGFYLYKDDDIRIEDTPLSILTETADILAQKIDNQTLTVSFFHLDSTLLRRYEPKDLAKIVDIFR